MVDGTKIYNQINFPDDTSNGFVKTTGGDGTISIDTNTYSVAGDYVENSAGTLTLGNKGGTYVQLSGNSTWTFPLSSTVLGKEYTLMCHCPYGFGVTREQITLALAIGDAFAYGGNHQNVPAGSDHILPGNATTWIATSVGWKLKSFIKLINPVGGVGT